MEGASRGHTAESDLVNSTSVQFVNPKGTAVLSVTGRDCSLNCAHCGRIYLRHMLPLGRLEQLSPGNYSSLLISGGCDPQGRVPLWKVADMLPGLAREYRLNLHTGLIDEGLARRVAPYASVVSFDFVGDDATIQEVYGLPRSFDDYVRAYESLKRLARVVPHICIGLRGGEISGEYRAIDTLAALGAGALVFLVLIPTRGTRFAHVRPPRLDEVTDIIEYARSALPSTPLYLGCMRPGGTYRDELDLAALQLGVQRIVMPSRKAEEHARRLGMNISYSEECCAF